MAVLADGARHAAAGAARAVSVGHALAPAGDPIESDRSDGGPIRAFVAIRIDDAARAALAREIDRLRAVSPGVAWVETANLHLTLKFLGGVERALLEPLTDTLRRALEDAPAFDLELVGLGAFPTATRARVVWAGVAAGREPMRELAERVDVALEALGFAREARPFAPHLTLGRVRAPRRDDRLAAFIAEGAGRSFGTVRVGSVGLMQSTLSPRGARYSELGAVSLCGH